jgi:hypothetical protein
MTTGQPLSAEQVVALLKFAGIQIGNERAGQLATASQELFAEVNRVSAFMGPRREIGMDVKFSHAQDRTEG